LGPTTCLSGTDWYRLSEQGKFVSSRFVAFRIVFIRIKHLNSKINQSLVIIIIIFHNYHTNTNTNTKEEAPPKSNVTLTLS